MADFLLRTGDLLQITMVAPTVVPAVAKPVALRGSSTTVSAIGKLACLRGDELPDELKVPVPYTEPPFLVPGTGTFSILLPPSHFTLLARNGLVLLLKGGPFPVVFKVATPATNPVPVPGVPKTDTKPLKQGTGQFLTTNATVRIG
jgi:hypothetical protein